MGVEGATILQVLPELNSGGVERGTVEIAEAIIEAGGRAVVASAGGRMVAELERLGATHLTLPLASKNPATIWSNAGRLAAAIRSEGVALAHARSRAPAWSALLAARRTGAAFVTTYHGAYNENLPLKRRYNSVMAKGDRVIAISEFIAEMIKTRHGVGAERVRVVPRGADLRRFSPEQVAPERIEALRARWRVAADASRPVIMLPGRLTRWKGQTLFIDALARLGARRYLALIVGGEKGAATLSGGPFETELRARIGQAGLTDRVQLVGPTDDMPAALSLADVVVSASLDPEAFGRVAVEAQAMGRPVVATAHGGATETVAPGATGWLCAPDDPAAMAVALGEALELDAARRSDMAAAARARVEARFSVAAMRAATLAVYKELIGP